MSTNTYGKASRSNTAYGIRREVARFFDSYERAIVADDKALRDSLEPGQTMPNRKGNELLTEAARNEAREACGAAARGIADEIGRARERLAADMTEPPDEAALRAIRAAGMAGAVDDALLESLEARYGRDNYLSHKAIAKLATDCGHMLKSENETAANLAALETAERALRHLNTYDVAGSPLGVASLRALALEACDDLEAGRANPERCESFVDAIPDGATYGIIWPE